MGLRESDPCSKLDLPPGFRFYPTDEELLVNYLCRRVAGQDFALKIIGDVDLYKFNAWDLPSKALFGEKEWYFFSPRDRKYPNGSRPNRVAGAGYWKATGTDKIITTEGRKVGIKKALVFYVGKAPKGTKTNWIMHEYRLSESPRKSGSSRLDDWVLCRIYKKNSGGDKSAGKESPPSSSSSQYGDVLDSLPEIDERLFCLPRMNFDHQQQLGSGNLDWATLAGLGPIRPEFVQAQNTQRNDGYAPGVVGENEVQSGVGTQRVSSNSGFFVQNVTGSTQGFSDPFGGVRYPAQNGGFGFRG